MGRFWCDNPEEHRRRGEQDARYGHVDRDMIRERYDDECAAEYARGVRREEDRREEERREEEADRRHAEQRSRDRSREDEGFEEAAMEFARQAYEAEQSFDEYAAACLATLSPRQPTTPLARRWAWSRSFRAGARFPGSG